MPSAHQTFDLTIGMAGFLPDPSAIIADLSPGGGWDGGGDTYLVPAGAWITQTGVTIENAQFTMPYQGFITTVSVSGNTMELDDASMATIMPLDLPDIEAAVGVILDGQLITGNETVTKPGNGIMGTAAISAVNLSDNTITLVPTAGSSISTLLAGHTYEISTVGKHEDQNGQKQEYSVKPLVRVEANGAILNNITAIGGNGGNTGYHADLVGQAGIIVLQGGTVASPVIINDCSGENTYGDSLTLGSGSNPVYVTVNGFTSSYAGRVGVTVDNVQGTAQNPAVLTDITITNATTNNVDFEADVPAAGSAYVEMVNLVSDGDVRLIEALTGPVTFTNMEAQGGFWVYDRAGISQQPINVNGGSLTLRRNPSNPPATIFLDGGAQVTMTDVVMAYAPGNVQPGPAWVVQEAIKDTGLPPPAGPSDLTLTGCTIGGIAPTQANGIVVADGSSVTIN